ncbi:hypothetical protein APHAL10511_002742 [Amanita phalloides]|nr:hypothetical protein APHAL10511_002742 [Amanita phalloides]
MLTCVGLAVIAAFLAFLSTSRALGLLNGPQAANFWRLSQLQKTKSSRQLAAGSIAEFKPRWFRQPLDHFNNETTDTWLQRYWVSTRHYKPGSGGPVIVLDGGETDATERLPYLDTGIVDILTRYLGGVGVVLEHRYYGESYATQNLTTDSLRFLNNEQALADSANFMANVKFAGINENLTAPKTPWIYYGGSYAGARSAHMKVVYPDLVYGAIASSGVTEAIIDDWEYFEIIRRAANPECMSRVEVAIKQIDSIIDDGKHTKALKALFGLQNITHDIDFLSTISNVFGNWQSKNWDPSVDSSAFDIFCSYMNASATSASSESALADGYQVDIGLINYAKYAKENVATQCAPRMTQDECFGTFNNSLYQITTLDQTWRLWQFQVCTQWGFYQAAPPDPSYPRIVSRYLTVDYLSKICKQAYLPGKYFTVPSRPNITDVNRLGGYAIAADRLAIIDGQVDPWRPCTPHAYVARHRRDTTIRPFKLIPNAVHHYDENGLANISMEPPEIYAIHAQEVALPQAADSSPYPLYLLPPLGFLSPLSAKMATPIRKKRNFKALQLSVSQPTSPASPLENEKEADPVPMRQAPVPAPAPSQRRRPPPMTLTAPKISANGTVVHSTEDTDNILLTVTNSAGCVPNTASPSARNNYHAALSSTIANLDLNTDMKFELRNEDFKDLQELGQGNGGSVKKVEHTPTGTIMAKKIVLIDAKPSVRKQILRELLIMHDCKSKYIISFWGAFLADPNICICMEYMDKCSLDGIYKKIGAIEIDIVARVALAVLEGLTYLYDVHRIIHRDIKPSNILCNSQGEIKICDFGVSGELINSIADTFVGTSTYMSPERIQGAQYTVKSDVWSLGITLIELALGRFPFSESSDDSESEFSDLDGTLSPSHPGGMNLETKAKRAKKRSKKDKRKSKGVSLQGGRMMMSILELLQHIVNEPAPKLTPDGRFPREAENFVNDCLLKNPDQRKTPNDLMKHAWIEQARVSDVDVKAWANSF